ncbi:MAG: FAD-binding protein [Actinomycetota bacterium]
MGTTARREAPAAVEGDGVEWRMKGRDGRPVTGVRMTGLDGYPVEVGAKGLEAFTANVRGPVLRPDDAGFDEAVSIWNGMISRRPALVVRPVSAGDVREAVRFAAAHGVRLSMKGGGHNIAGTSLADGALTLDMSLMRSVEVDAGRRVAHVGAGCRLQDVDRATQAHGLATVLGFVSETGVAGLTLGGGMGYLTRRFGWTVDNLEEVEIVTADGTVRRAAAGEHEDLFWAVRGGGGNFGVVTRFTFRLHEVGPEMTGGLIVWEAERAEDVLARYREVSEAAPRELTLAVTIRLAPPAPFIPERWHGRPVIGILACHTGNTDQAAKDLAPIRALGNPVADVIVRKRYVEQQAMLDATQPKGLHYYWKSEFLPGLSDQMLETYRQRAAAVASPMSQAVIFQLGGALADQDPRATSFGNRDASYIFFAQGSWPATSPDADHHLAWVRTAWESIRPYSTGGNYVNVQTFDEDDSRVEEAYRDNLEQLASVKSAYDPDNLFRVNRNIRPGGKSAHSYLLAGQPSELERLQLQAKVWEPSGRGLLDRMGDGQGCRVLDVGCGALGWLRILSDWVGPSGRVVGTDVDEKLLEAAGKTLKAGGSPTSSSSSTTCSTAGWPQSPSTWSMHGS